MTESNIAQLEALLFASLIGGAYDILELKSRLQPTTSFAELGLDSLDLTEFFLRIQDDFDISIPQEDFAELGSLGQMSRYLLKS